MYRIGTISDKYGICIITKTNKTLYGESYRSHFKNVLIGGFYFSRYHMINEDVDFLRGNFNNLEKINMLDYKNRIYVDNYEDVISLFTDMGIDFLHTKHNSRTLIRTKEPLSDDIITILKLLGSI